MKKQLVLVSTLISVLAFSMPVFAASPTAAKALTPTQKAEVTSTASQLLSSGAVSSQAAATAVATSSVDIKAAGKTEEALDKETTALYNKMDAAKKAVIDDAAKKRNMSAQEVIGNYIKADKELFDLPAKIEWSEALCMSAVDDKAGSVNCVLSRPTVEVSKELINLVKKTNAEYKTMGTFQLNLQGRKGYKKVDTAIAVSGVTEKDTVANFKAYQKVGNKLVAVKITSVSKGAIGIQVTNSLPVIIVRVQ